LAFQAQNPSTLCHVLCHGDVDFICVPISSQQVSLCDPHGCHFSPIFALANGDSHGYQFYPHHSIYVACSLFHQVCLRSIYCCNKCYIHSSTLFHHTFLILLIGHYFAMSMMCLHMDIVTIMTSYYHDKGSFIFQRLTFLSLAT
jgi:hypothetical protein